MTVPENESDQQIADDVLPIKPDDDAIPVELDTLQPWHRPRKQFVRERQWIHFSRNLIEKEKETQGLQEPVEGLPEVRYLTLPGIDYLDVRLLAKLCAELDCYLTSTGFLAGDEGNPHIARAKICEESLVKAGHITDKSHTFRARFEEIAPPQSPAYEQLKNKGPFHIVNIDACGSIAAPTAQHAKRLIDAIFRLLEFQFAKKVSPWLLFLTADIRYDSIATETLGNLCEAIFENAQKNSKFHDAVISFFNRNGTDIQEVVKEASSNPGQKFLSLFSLGFAKWLLHLAHEKDWDMKTHSTYCYSTEVHGNETPTMACLAFEFLPPHVSLEDPFNVTNITPAATGEAIDRSSRALNKITSMVNLDHRMKSCNGLRREMAQKTKELLEEAGYLASVLSELEA